MTITAFAGPVVSFGQAPFADYNPEAGPSLFFNGVGILDTRLPFAYEPGQDFGNVTAGWLGVDNITTFSAAPAALSSTAIAAAAATTLSTPMTLVAASSSTTGIASGLGITRSDTGVNVTGLLGIDAYTSVSGYICNGTSGTAGNLLIVTTASAIPPLTIGMVLAPTGGSACTITGFGPGTGTTGGGLGLTGVYTVSGPAQSVGTSGSPVTVTATLGTATGNSVSNRRLPFGSAGTIQLWNPQALSGRAVAIYPVSGTPTGNITFTVAGYDIYGYPMSEAISLTSGSTQNTAVPGKKAFGYIASVTPSATDTVTYSVGTTNIFGLPLRSDSFGDILINYATSLSPALITANTGYVAAVTIPATTTTGDVRGTYTATPSAGVNRFVFRQSPALYNIGSSTGLTGVTQA